MKMRFGATRLGLVALLVLSGLATAPSTAKAYTATGYLTFESGADGSVVGDTIEGVSLTNDGGGGWSYGDIRTHNYNAPYPESCLDRPGAISQPVCDYAVSGSVFLWLGPLGRSGRIAFTQGTASFIEASFSTGADISVIAYSPQDRPIAAQTVRTNKGTGQLERLRLVAPAGQQIASVVVTGNGSLWLLDDFATDAPGVPDQRPRRDHVDSAFVTVALHAVPNATVQRAGVITYTLVTTNRGKGSAKKATLQLTFNPALIRVLDAKFSRESMWVSKLESGQIEVQTAALGSGGDVVTTTLRLAVLANAADGADVGGRLTFTWADDSGGGEGLSNAVALVVGASDASTPYANMAVSPASGPAGSKPVFTSKAFIPGEPISFWYNKPDGSVQELNTVVADNNGVLVGTFDTTGLPVGSYSMVGRGNWSGITAVGAFAVGE